VSAYNFTEPVRRVLAMARDEAVHLNHEYVRTEHILLGLLNEGEGLGAAVLRNLNVAPQKIRREIETVLQPGHLATLPPRDLPYDSRAKNALDLAAAQARLLNHNYVGTEHVLLGLIRERKGIAAQVLDACGVTYVAASDEVLRLLDPSTPRSEAG
jgi:ATP-dependent Clp protease ATP-binding subunit ClpC